MANPQLEDGFTQIAHEILENLMRTYLPPNQWQVLLCIIRKTYGFRKKIDWIANCQIAEATGLGKTTVSRALARLKEQGLISRNGKKTGFQKDWELWKVSRTANFAKLNKAKVSRTANFEELAVKDTEKLAEQPTQLAEQLTKVSSPRDTQKKKETIQKKLYKRKYGEFQNVLLTDEECQKLKDKLGAEAEKFIETLSGYLEQHKKRHYDSHYATILNWWRKEQNGKDKGRRLPQTYTESPNDDI